jgi:hypothetical protein
MEPRVAAKPFSRPHGEKAMRRGLPSTPEWGTPKWLIDSATATMGEITTDPCTSAIFKGNINAQFAYDIEDNGLIQPWHGAVFINPPLKHARAFWARLTDDWDQGLIEQGMFVSSYPDHAHQLCERFVEQPYKLVDSPQESRRTVKVKNRIRPFCDEVATCMFKTRVKFLQHRPDWPVPGFEESKGAMYGGNFLTYLPPKLWRDEALRKFAEEFNKHGFTGIFMSIV